MKKTLIAIFIASISSLPSIADEHAYAMRTISITGEGNAFAVPDMATITSGVVTNSDNAKDALFQNNANMSAVIDSFKNAGIPEMDISTNGFSVQPRYHYDNEGKKPPQVIGYEVRNNVTVRIKDLTILGTVLDQAVSSGANNVNGLSFSVSNTSELLDEARLSAIQDARRKAEVYAHNTNSRLGSVVTISEGSPVHIPRPVYAMADTMKLESANSVPVQAGEQELSVNVSVVWELIPLAITY